MANQYDNRDDLKGEIVFKLDLIQDHIHDLPLDRLKRAWHSASIDEREYGRMVLDDEDEKRLNISGARRSIYEQELEKRGIPRSEWYSY